MSRKGRWWRNQQRRNEEFRPRGSNQSQHNQNGDKPLKGSRLGSYHVTHPHQPKHIPPAHDNVPLQRELLRHDHPYKRPHTTSSTTIDFRFRSQQLKLRLIEYLEKSLRELEEWYPEAETHDCEMDWKPEVEVLIPQMDGGMQWAWGHERPEVGNVPASSSSSREGESAECVGKLLPRY